MSVQSFASSFRPYNPFIAMVEEQPLELELDVAEATECEEQVSYALVQSGPAVAADEVESHLDSVEVKVTWGTQVLSVNHLETGKGFSIGEGGDFVVPNVSLETEIVGVRGGAWFVSVPASATAKVYARGESPSTLNAGEELEVRAGMRVSMEIEGVTIEVSAVRAGKKLQVGFLASLAGGAAAAIGLSFFGHTAIVACMALFMPSMAADDAEANGKDQILVMQTAMNTAADREADRPKPQPAGGENNAPGSSDAPKGPAGELGTPKPTTDPGRVARKGSSDHMQTSSSSSHEDEITEATNGGFIKMLKQGHSELGHDEDPWGKERAGQDAEDSRGAKQWVPNIGELPGTEGWATRGDKNGGGGTADVIVIDGVDTKGHGKGQLPGDGDDGFGKDHGKVQGNHITKAPKMPVEGIVNTNGHLPADVIQRIVRLNFGKFRLCYESGLRGNPTLSGRVVTKFVIGRDGQVMQSLDGGSDMPSQEVTSCVIRSFQNLSFPEPQSGIVTVSYPITFEPGE